MVQIIKNALGEALGSASAAIGGALKERGKKRTEFQTQQKAATAFEQAATEASTDPVTGQPREITAPVLMGILSRYQKAGGKTADLGPLMQALTPGLREQAKVQGAQQYRESIFGKKTPGGGISEEAEISTPQGTIYEQIDGVPDNISQDQIDALISSPYPQLQAEGKQYEDRRKQGRKQFESDRTFNTTQLKKGEEKILGLRESLPKKHAALLSSRDAIQSNEIGPMSMNAIADMIGGPIGDAIRTSKGAELAFASKENLISNLSRVSARSQNKWMEQQMKGAFAKVGQTGKANMQVQIQAEQDYLMEQAYLDKRDELATKDRQRFGYVRADVDQRAYEAVKETENALLKRSAYLSRNQYEEEKGEPWMYKQVNKKVLQGTPITTKMFRLFSEKLGTPEQALKRAKQLGYTIPKKNEVLFAQENLLIP